MLLTRARHVLVDVAQIRADLTAIGTTVQGLVTLCVSPSVGLVLLAPLVSQIRAEFSGIQMRVLEGFSGQVAEWLTSGRVDLAVLYKVRAEVFPDAEHLLSENMYLVSARDAAPLGQGATVALCDLAGHDLALPGAPHGLHILVDEACARAGQPDRRNGAGDFADHPRAGGQRHSPHHPAADSGAGRSEKRRSDEAKDHPPGE